MNTFKTCIILMSCLHVMFGCVPRKKLIYLQPDQKGGHETFEAKDKEYQLKPKDVIAINIFSFTPGQFDIFGQGEGGDRLFAIDLNGYVELPGIGETQVAGLTIKETQNKIRNLLEDYLRSPLVRITLQTPFVFTTLGEIGSQGRHTVVGAELNIMEAIAMAGGLTNFADRKNIRLIRNENGEVIIKQINVLDEDLLASEYYQIKSNDIIIADPLPVRSFRENQLFTFTTVIGLVSSTVFFLTRLSRL